MSNLLERAIIDAKALKEAALKNAEQLVVEKYSQEVKQAVSQLLEVEEDAAMADLFGEEPDPGMADLDLAPDLAQEDGEEEILATLEGDAETDFKTLRVNMREAKTEFVDKKAFNSVKSFGLRLSGSDVATDFEINDIQVVFREKSVK